MGRFLRTGNRMLNLDHVVRVDDLTEPPPGEPEYEPHCVVWFARGWKVDVKGASATELLRILKEDYGMWSVQAAELIERAPPDPAWLEAFEQFARSVEEQQRKPDPGSDPR